jgi:hypothetical protein
MYKTKVEAIIYINRQKLQIFSPKTSGFSNPAKNRLKFSALLIFIEKTLRNGARTTRVSPHRELTQKTRSAYT